MGGRVGGVVILKAQFLPFYHYFQELKMVRKLKCLADILEISAIILVCGSTSPHLKFQHNYPI